MDWFERWARGGLVVLLWTVAAFLIVGFFALAHFLGTAAPTIVAEPGRSNQQTCAPSEADRLVELAREAERWRCAESIRGAQDAAFDAGFLAGAFGCDELKTEEPQR